jgi:hypothetical protein
MKNWTRNSKSSAGLGHEQQLVLLVPRVRHHHLRSFIKHLRPNQRHPNQIEVKTGII